MELFIFLCLLGINVFVAFYCWEVLTTPKKINIHWRLMALWAFLANMAVFGFNFWLALGLFYY
jgi:hypothetical protein